MAKAKLAQGAIPCAGKGQSQHAPFLTLFLIWRLRNKASHGYAIVQDMRGMSVSAKKPSTVYLILNKLEKAGMVKSRAEKCGGRMRKIYHTTDRGWAVFERIRRQRVRGMLREFIMTLAG